MKLSYETPFKDMKQMLYSTVYHMVGWFPMVVLDSQLGGVQILTNN